MTGVKSSAVAELPKALRHYHEEDRGQAEPCWVWTGPFTASGCPRYLQGVAGHPIYEALVEPIPDRLILGSLCGHRDCVRPAHRKPMRRGEHVKRHDPMWLELDRGYKTPCWVWQWFVRDNGYGQMDGIGAHRWVYEQRVGPIPKNHVVHHLCRVKACVNPAHLGVVPNGEHHRIHWRQYQQGLIPLGAWQCPNCQAVFDPCDD